MNEAERRICVCGHPETDHPPVVFHPTDWIRKVITCSGCPCEEFREKPAAPPPLDEAEVIARHTAKLNPWLAVLLANYDRMRTQLDKPRYSAGIAGIGDRRRRAEFRDEAFKHGLLVVDFNDDAGVTCGDRSGPNSGSAECVLGPGHPHRDGHGGEWPVTAEESR